MWVVKTVPNFPLLCRVILKGRTKAARTGLDP